MLDLGILLSVSSDSVAVGGAGESAFPKSFSSEVRLMFRGPRFANRSLEQADEASQAKFSPQSAFFFLN